MEIRKVYELTCRYRRYKRELGYLDGPLPPVLFFNNMGYYSLIVWA